MKSQFVAIIASVILTGCGGSGAADLFETDCRSPMDDTRSSNGVAEEVQNFSSDGYNSETWWYWTKGISYTFTWGTSACKVSTYTFSPIKK